MQYKNENYPNGGYKMNLKEQNQLKIQACKSRLGAILGTYNAKSGHPGGSLF